MFKSRNGHSIFLKKYEGVRKTTLEDREVTIVVSDKSVIEKFVKIGNLPPNLSLGVIKNRFSNYGNIKSLNDIRWETYQNKLEPDYFPVKTGWLIIKMVVDTNIPSYVNVGSYRAIVRYSGQIKTCRQCDSENHLWEGCPQNWKNRKLPPPEQVTLAGEGPPPTSEPQAQVGEEVPTPSPMTRASVVCIQETPNISTEGETEAENGDGATSGLNSSPDIPSGEKHLSIADDESGPSQVSLEVSIPPTTPTSISQRESGMEIEEVETPTTQKRGVRSPEVTKLQNMNPTVARHKSNNNKKFKPNMDTIKKLTRK